MDASYIFSCLLILMIMIAKEYLIFQKKNSWIAINIWYYQYLDINIKFHPVLYNYLNRFTFVGINELIFFYHTCFTPDKIYQLLPLLCLYEIRLYNYFETTSKEAFAIVLICFSYPTYYWSIIDCYGHNRTWISIVFNDTIIYLYWQFQKLLSGTEKELTFEKLSKYTLAIHNISEEHCFWSLLTELSTLLADHLLIKKNFVSDINESIVISINLLLHQIG